MQGAFRSRLGERAGPERKRRPSARRSWFSGIKLKNLGSGLYGVTSAWRQLMPIASHYPEVLLENPFRMASSLLSAQHKPSNGMQCRC